MHSTAADRDFYGWLRGQASVWRLISMEGMSPTVGEGRGASSANLLTVGDGLKEALWWYLSIDKKGV